MGDVGWGESYEQVKESLEMVFVIFETLSFEVSVGTVSLNS